MASYVGNQVSQLETTPDGFTSVGDLGWLDEDGFLFMADRRSDMIVSGGVNVFPAEVEAALSEHPQIHDVVAIGLADETWGRRVHAIVVATDDSLDADSGDRVRQGSLGRLQGAQDGRVHRRHPADRGDEVQPFRPGRRARGSETQP